jgi:hypothetical protein
LIDQGFSPTEEKSDYATSNTYGRIPN